MDPFIARAVSSAYFVSVPRTAETRRLARTALACRVWLVRCPAKEKPRYGGKDGEGCSGLAGGTQNGVRRWCRLRVPDGVRVVPWLPRRRMWMVSSASRARLRKCSATGLLGFISEIHDWVRRTNLVWVWFNGPIVNAGQGGGTSGNGSAAGNARFGGATLPGVWLG